MLVVSGNVRCLFGGASMAIEPLTHQLRWQFPFEKSCRKIFSNVPNGLKHDSELATSCTDLISVQNNPKLDFLKVKSFGVETLYC